MFGGLLPNNCFSRRHKSVDCGRWRAWPLDSETGSTFHQVGQQHGPHHSRRHKCESLFVTLRCFSLTFSTEMYTLLNEENPFSENNRVLNGEKLHCYIVPIILKESIFEPELPI